MKRSEMIQIIINAGPEGQRPGWIDGEYSDGMKESVANDILIALEKAGMQPAPHQELIGSGYADEYGNEESEDVWVQGWELELLGPNKIISNEDFDRLAEDLTGEDNG